MKITPLDIQKKNFSKSWRGIDPGEVSGFLEMVADEMEKLVRENIDLKEEIRRKNAKIDEYDEREKILQETLVTAQKLTNEIKDQTRKDSESILAEAERKAERIVQDAHQRLVEIIKEINELKRARTQFSSDIRHQIESHLNLLESIAEGSSEPDTGSAEDNITYFTPRSAAGNGEGRNS